jgi:hypothetical protein
MEPRRLGSLQPSPWGGGPTRQYLYVIVSTAEYAIAIETFSSRRQNIVNVQKKRSRNERCHALAEDNREIKELP